MKKLTVIMTLAGFLFALPVLAQDKDDAKAAPESTAQTTAEKLKEQPNDMNLLRQYMAENIPRLRAQFKSDPDAAEKQIKEMLELFESLKPDQPTSQRLLLSAKAYIKQQEKQLELARTTIEELEKKLTENPDDAASVAMYASKTMMETSSIARSEPDQAESKIKAAKLFLASVKEKAQEDATKKAIDNATSRSFAQIERIIEGAKKLLALVGTDAASLKDQVEGWVNGQAVSDGDLKGKVVLLDFWAVWCGPCVATFPHLREWHEKYADKGLVIIGLTNYYNYAWDAEAGRGVRSQEKVSPEAEQAMLAEFCEHHNLHHRIALQKGSELSEHYAVSGIPHVVVIDREGKVQLIRVGSGEANAKAIGDLLEKLVGA